MNAAWELSLLFVLIVVLEGVCSWQEQTFYPGQSWERLIKLPFIFHGGVVVGDFVLLPYAFHLWFPQMHVVLWAKLILLVIAAGITWVAHRAWWFMCEKQPGFMYPDRSESLGNPSDWYLDLPLSAWIHFVYMVLAIMMIGGYIVSPMSADVVWTTFWIFVVFIPLAIIEPGIVQGWPPTVKDMVNAVGVATVLLGIVGAVTWVKLAHWFGV